jgi:hypothetical protein
MRSLTASWLSMLVAVAWLPAHAEEIAAGAATARAVTIYRAPSRDAGPLQLDYLAGFALISETRAVNLPAGESRLRFDGVADGIESASALISGLPADVVEKNRDARVLSPQALLAGAIGQEVLLVRTEPRSGRTERIGGTIRSADGDAVVFESAQGIEALHCSGLPEAVSFSTSGDLSPTPTMSVLVHTREPISATVTLSYLAHGFDWSANYVATLSADAKSMDIGAWVTLANGNGTSFPAAHAQVVAGRLNRESGDVEPFEYIQPVAQCWPRGSTSDPAVEPRIELAMPLLSRAGEMRRRSENLQEVPVAISAFSHAMVEQEQLGDLKLYRIPDLTDVRSRQMKQVRLLDRHQVPVQLFYRVDAYAPAFPHTTEARSTVELKLRTRNDRAHHLGLPLPQGQVVSFMTHGTESLLLHQSPLHDTAVDEEVEFALGSDTQVQVSAPAVDLHYGSPNHMKVLDAIDIHNSGPEAVAIELRLHLDPDTRLLHAQPAPSDTRGMPLFKLSVPARGSMTIHYQTSSS